MRGAVLLPLVAACAIGTSAREFAPAMGPQGVQADLRLARNERVRGELLEVQDSALLVLGPEGATLVPLRSIRTGRFRQYGTLIRRGRLIAEYRERLRLVSRFPAGLTPELRARFLRSPERTEPSDTALAAFLRRARTGSEPYRDPDVARAAGYRPMGPDFPGMGRHWVHPGLILRDTPDAEQPPILEYAELAGRLTLVGVAYGVLVRGDTVAGRSGAGRVPAAFPVPPGAWHFHAGTVTEESFIRSHARLDHGGEEPGAGGPRIAVLHAWVWLDNPDGPLVTDNWALPYARWGYAAPPPGDGPRDAGRALALAAGPGGAEYVKGLLRAVGEPEAGERAALDGRVEHHAAAARALAGGAGRPPVAELARCWADFWRDVEEVVRPAVWERLRAVR